MVDAADLKSASRKGVWVRVPPSAYIKSPGSANKGLPDLLNISLSKLLNTFWLGFLLIIKATVPQDKTQIRF